MKRSILGIALATVPLLGAAADTGPFLEASFGRAGFRLEPIAGLDTSERNTTVSLGAGYMFNKFVGVEAGYRKLGEVAYTGNVAASGSVFGKPYAGIGNQRAAADVEGWYFGPLLQVPVAEKIRLNFRLGMFRWTADESLSATGAKTYATIVYPANNTASLTETRTKTYFGGGGVYSFAPNWDAGLGFTRYNKVIDTHVYTWDVRIRFSF